jgi:hypothetical protein
VRVTWRTSDAIAPTGRFAVGFFLELDQANSEGAVDDSFTTGQASPTALVFVDAATGGRP